MSSTTTYGVRSGLSVLGVRWSDVSAAREGRNEKDGHQLSDSRVLIPDSSFSNPRRLGSWNINSSIYYLLLNSVAACGVVRRDKRTGMFLALIPDPDGHGDAEPDPDPGGWCEAWSSLDSCIRASNTPCAGRSEAEGSALH